jgi:hypothetical protein
MGEVEDATFRRNLGFYKRGRALTLAQTRAAVLRSPTLVQSTDFAAPPRNEVCVARKQSLPLPCVS